MLSFLCATLLPIALALLFLRHSLWRDAPAEASETRALLADVDQLLAAGRLSPEEHAAARAELESWLLAEANKGEGAGNALSRQLQALKPALKPALLAAALPPLAVALYLLFTPPDSAEADTQVATEAVTAPSTQTQLAQTASELAARVEQEPGNARAWTALARAYRLLGRWAEAARAYERLGPLLAQSPELQAEYAEVLRSLAAGRLAELQLGPSAISA